jgi:integrase
MSLTIYKRGAIWHYRGTVAGRRLRGSTLTADEEIARQVASGVENRAWKGHLYGPEAVLTFAQAAILYRQAQKPTRFLARIEDYWRDTLVRDITPGAIRQSAIALFPSVSGATRNRQVIVPTQAIINHAAEMELCRSVKVKRFPVETKSKEPATWEWVEAFMSCANPHLGALACFMFLTGARVTEALNVRWQDVDLTAGRALIRQTKIGAERRAHLPGPLVAAIANIEGEKIGKVFRYSSRMTAKIQWNAAIKRAGIKHLSFHACRHGFATALLRSGVDPITVAKLGGWKDARHVFTTYGHAAAEDTQADRIWRSVGTKLTQAGDEHSTGVAENASNIKMVSVKSKPAG